MLVNSNLKVVLTPPSPIKYIFSLYYIPIASSFSLREALIFGRFFVFYRLDHNWGNFGKKDFKQLKKFFCGLFWRLS